jgi:hypothetical protein
MDGEALAPGAEMIPEPNDDETAVFEGFLVAGLRMPPCILHWLMLY